MVAVGQGSDRDVRNGTQVVGRVFDILDAFLTVGPRLTVAELSRHLGLTYSTARRLLEAMAERGALTREPVSRRYRIGPGLRRFSSSGPLEDSEQVRPYLERVTDLTGESSHLAILDDGWAVYVESVLGAHILSPHRHVGRRLPAHCTGVGKVLIANAPAPELARILGRGLPRYTPNTIVDPAALRRELSDIRACGYAIDNEETEEGLICVAAPVHDASGAVVAALSIGGPASRLGTHLVETARSVVQCADELSSSLGWRPT
jgi:DNA-binding IclR family transcriptional regulator